MRCFLLALTLTLQHVRVEGLVVQAAPAHSMSMAHIVNTVHITMSATWGLDG